MEKGPGQTVVCTISWPCKISTEGREKNVIYTETNKQKEIIFT